MNRAAHTLSVCVPNYNGADFLPGMLEALFAQSYAPDEILLLDDASTDRSLEILAEYEQRDPRVRVLRHETNRGVAEAFLALVDAAASSHILLASVDDRVLPGLLEESMAMLERHPSAGFCSALSRRMDAKGNDRGIFPSPVIATEPTFIPPAAVPDLLPMGLIGWFVMGNVTVFNRGALHSTARRCLELGPYLDGFATQVIALERGACFIPRPLGSWREWEDSFSGKMRRDPGWQRSIGDAAHRLMTGEFAHLFPAGYAGTFRQEVEAQAELDAREGEGSLARLRSEIALRRRHGLPLGPALARRLRFRLDGMRRRRIERRTR